jgi:predicted GNAT superfamily acetyltransferase
MTDAPDITSMKRVTDLHDAPADVLTTAVDAAVQSADAAANAAGVTVRELHDLDALDGVYRLYDEIWRPDPSNPPVTTELMRALTKAGNYVAGAFDGDKLVGACVGFFGAPADEAMHSHIAGVSAGMRGRNVGFALKLHQRAWALLQGVSEIAWTFDPLICRNAYFNVAKLGACVSEYLPNFYGGMHDSINAGDDTDRVLIRWPLTAPAVVAACAGVVQHTDAAAARAAGAALALGTSADGGPVAGPADAATLLVAVPPDIESLRSSAPALAREWRAAVREVLVAQLAAGARVTGFDRAGWYVLAAKEGEQR